MLEQLLDLDFPNRLRSRRRVWMSGCLAQASCLRKTCPTIFLRRRRNVKPSPATNSMLHPCMRLAKQIVFLYETDILFCPATGRTNGEIIADT